MALLADSIAVARGAGFLFLPQLDREWRALCCKLRRRGKVLSALGNSSSGRSGRKSRVIKDKIPLHISDKTIFS
ncbi:hypothetical protein J5J86_18880 [Aquabacter sp. L1I39]|uniref:hypothetical protein n=1 Tax=Aquabacter sp. L1I39 TaxID=2820278 RepID=UPI001AD9946F|nr:hypothetical protein [Aquabacter sp. L1I39]QTL02817.1 hypothetical protein J5J86_18880 [Aquabacter sp. L1I39]